MDTPYNHAVYIPYTHPIYTLRMGVWGDVHYLYIRELGYICI